MAGSTGVPSRRSQHAAAGVLDRLPAWATTGVGSLPHTFPDHAAAHVAGEYDVPFCPQLPRLEGDMVREWLGADPLRCGWGPDRDRERPAAWGAFLAAVDAPPARPRRRQAPGHRPGDARPRARAGRRRGRRGASPARSPPGSPRTPRGRSRRSATAASTRCSSSTSRRSPPTRCRRACGTRCAPSRPAWGLHLCCAVPWHIVDRAEPDVLSFDLAAGGVDRSGARVLTRLLARGGRVAWGVLAAHRPAERAAHAAWRLSAALARLGASPATVGASSLLTASCGTGRLSPRREAEVTAALAYVASAAR